MKAPTSFTQITDTDDFNTPVGVGLTIVSIEEAESIVQSLEPFPVEEIGCSPFLRMYAFDVERLTLQAHACAKRKDGDEYVVDSIITHGKISVLVKTLLAIEAWRLFVLRSNSKQGPENSTEASPSLAQKLADNQASLRCAFILHTETTLCSLLNLIIYRKENCDELDDDTAVALVDYCARQMSCLASPLGTNEMVQRQKDPGTVEEIAEKIQKRSPVEEIHENKLDTEYKTAVVATSLARHLCEHIECLPIGAQTRILDTHDYLQMMVPLIDEPPWTRRRKSSRNGGIKWEKLYDNTEWKEVAPGDLLQITQCEAQCWLAVFHLTCSKTCRERYALNVFRKEQLLRLRKYLNEIMQDQLPVLTDVVRYMDELALMDVPEASTGQGSALLMQQVDRLRDAIVKGRDWGDIGEKQFEAIFSKHTDAQDHDLRLIADIYDENSIFGMTNDVPPNSSQVYITSLPITCISIRAETNGSSRDVYNLTPCDDGTILKSEQGDFRRNKLKLHPCSEDGEPVLFDKKLVLEAAVSVEKFDNILNLSLVSELSETNRKMQWVQLGRTEKDNLVLQLGFKMSSSCELFELRQAFVSRPV